MIAGVHYQSRMCSLTSPTSSTGNNEWIKQEADRVQLGWHHQEQQKQQQQEERHQELQRELLQVTAAVAATHRNGTTV